AAAPLVTAELVWARDSAGHTRPSWPLQDGIRTRRSRGKLMPIAWPPPGDRCSRMIVSERGGSFVIRRPYLALAPERVSDPSSRMRSEEHTSELQSRENLVCRLLLEKKKSKTR